MTSGGKQRHAWAGRRKLRQVGADWGKLELAHCSHCLLSTLCFVHYLCQCNKLCESLRCHKWTKRVRLTDRKLMAHHRNQNGFTWKKQKQIACITVHCRRVIAMDLKVNAPARSMWTLSTAGPFSLTKNHRFKYQRTCRWWYIDWNHKQTDRLLPAKLANYSQNG